MDFYTAWGFQNLIFIAAIVATLAFFYAGTRAIRTYFAGVQAFDDGAVETPPRFPLVRIVVLAMLTIGAASTLMRSNTWGPRADVTTRAVNPEIQRQIEMDRETAPAVFKSVEDDEAGRAAAREAERQKLIDETRGDYDALKPVD